MVQDTNTMAAEGLSNNMHSHSSGNVKKSPSKSRWNVLSKSLLELDEKNYAQQSNVIVIELQGLLLAEPAGSNNIAMSVMYILYERALRELVTSAFPVSASISDALCNSTDIYTIIQSLMKVHFQDLVKKLESCSKLTCNEVGIVFLFLSIYKLNKLGGKNSSLTVIFDMTIKGSLNYIQSYSDFSDINLLLMLLYSLISYSLEDGKIDDKTVLLVDFIRRALIKYGDSISQFTKVLVLDILERLQNNKPIQLYEAIYEKIFQPEIFIIPGLNTFIGNVPYPESNGNGTREHQGIVSSFNELSVSSSSASDDADIDFVAHQLQDDEASVSALTEEPVSLVGNHVEIDAENHVERNNDDLQSVVDNNDTSIEESDEKSPQHTKPSLKWSVSTIQKTEPVVEEKLTEILTVPEKYIGRVVGFQGAIARKLELETNAVIEVCKPDEPPRPVTSSLTAHKLVTGCLGMPPQIPSEQIEEEKLKLSNAKVRRQTEEKGEQMRAIQITGSEKEIYEAMRLVQDIITCVVTIHIYLEFSVDELLEKYEGKLKTIEMLLNIYLEVEELENGKVVLNISGDENSCQDAKKLIFEEIGSFRSQHGHLFFIPQEMMSVLNDKSGVDKIVETVQFITSARILSLSSSEGFAVFISGFQHQVNRSLQVFQKINADVMCCLSDPVGEDLTIEDVCLYIKECFKRGSQGENKNRPTLLKKRVLNDVKKGRLVYSREKLLELSAPKYVTFPEELTSLKDHVIREIVVYECRKACCCNTIFGKR